ncbi:MAG: hypothetical protein ACOCWZ_08345 [Spirochaetota bacterium]
MKKIILLLFTMPLFIYFLTCDRADMQTIAKYGPEPDVIYLFSDTATTYDGAFTGYNGPEEACYIQYETYFTDLDITRIEPLLSTHERDVRDIIPDIYSHVEVIGIDETPLTVFLSSSWGDLWVTGPTGDLTSIGISGYWTGSTASGTLSTNNCNGWSDTGVSGTQGDGTPSSSWIEGSSTGCGTLSLLLCVGY